jgi:hypothetical protein
MRHVIALVLVIGATSFVMLAFYVRGAARGLVLAALDAKKG